jgi:hypothetical protein
VEPYRLNVDDFVDMESGHVGGEFRAGHASLRELVDVGALWIVDEHDKPARSNALLCARTGGGDTEDLEG